MGLDMYLYAERYIYDGEEKELKDKISETFPDTAEFGIKKITYDVGYWRKANAIHAWFVKNVQDGVDDCNPHYVTDKDLKKLLADCKACLMDSSMIMELLPPQDGFFFGSTSVDEDYYEDLKNTIEIIERIRNVPSEQLSIYYRSSW